MAHAVLVTLVPLVNLAVWIAVCRGDRRWRTALGWANGFAIGVALVYALLFLPATPFAVIGILVYGFGFVPLAPLVSLVCALVLRSRLRRRGAEGTPLPGLWRGAGAGRGVPGGPCPADDHHQGRTPDGGLGFAGGKRARRFAGCATGARTRNCCAPVTVASGAGANCTPGESASAPKPRGRFTTV